MLQPAAHCPSLHSPAFALLLLPYCPACLPPLPVPLHLPPSLPPCTCRAPSTVLTGAMIFVGLVIMLHIYGRFTA